MSHSLFFFSPSTLNTHSEHNSNLTAEQDHQGGFSLTAHTEQRAGAGPKSNSTEPPLHFYCRVYSLSGFTAG